MRTLDSKSGKRYSRKKIEERRFQEEKKKSKPVTILGIFLVLFSIFLLLFFAKERSKGIARENASPEFAEVINSMNELDGIDIFSSNSYLYKNHYDQFIANSTLTREEKEKAKENSDGSNIPSERPERKPGKLNNDIRLYLRDKGIDSNNIGFAYYNLNDGTYSSLNESETFQAGQTIGLPIVMYLFDQANQGRIDLNQRIMVEEKHLGGENGVLKDVRLGSTHSLFELAELIISQSDDVASNILYDYFGNRNGQYLLDTLANTYGISTYDGNYITPDEALMLLRRIFYNESANPLYYDLLEYLGQTKKDEFFTKNINEEKIAHLTGDFDVSYSDIGIVYGDESSYVFALYTRDVENADKVLGDIGQIVQDWHTGASD